MSLIENSNYFDDCLKVVFTTSKSNQQKDVFQILFAFCNGKVFESKEFSKFLPSNQTFEDLQELNNTVENYCLENRVKHFSMISKQQLNDSINNSQSLGELLKQLNLNSSPTKTSTDQDKFGFFKKFFQ